MRTTLATLLLLALVATACGAPSVTVTPPSASSDGASTSSPGSTGTPLPTPGPAGDAATVAAAVLHAPDDGARVAAVLGVLHGVNIGVYTPDGVPVVVGAERSEQDFWVYDFQAAALAAAVRDGDRVKLEDLAAEVADLATSNGGAPSTATQVVDAVLAGARSVAADPTQPRAYAMAVAIELGRQASGGTDLAAIQDADGASLDALAAFLVAADLMLPYVEGQAPPESASLLVASAAGGFPELAAQRCTWPGMGGSQGWVAGVNAGRFSGLSGVSNASFDRNLQGRLTGATVAAKLDGEQSWHHSHEDPDGSLTPVDNDQQYVFSLRLRVLAPTRPIQCGPLSATFFPSEGEIVGAAVRWNHPRLDLHGALREDTQTFAQGAAALEVEPKVEGYPSGIGPEQKEAITITAQANVLQALGGDLYQRLAGVPAIQSRSLDVEVSWHRSYAVEVEITSILTVTKGVTYKGELGVTTGEGTLPVIEFRNAAIPPRYAPGEIPNPGVLRTSASPARTQGDCNTEWILEKAGAKREIDWQVLDLALWPSEEIRLRLDTGANTTEQPDYYDGLICTPGGRVRLGPSPGNVWETMLFLGHPEGLTFQGTGSNAWTISGTLDTWARGGDLATWHSQETCGGRCKGFLDMVVRIRPLPGP